uniref:Uncharacterized protein n=1 Tax=Schizaphis graminum TaxID=13262 RepID=A0A2S2P4L2_SCHGA
MQNLMTDLKTIEFLIGKKRKNAQSTKMSENSEYINFITKLYFASMLNIKITTSGGDDRSVEPQQTLSAPPEYCPSPILLANYAGPQMRRMINVAKPYSR